MSEMQAKYQGRDCGTCSRLKSPHKGAKVCLLSREKTDTCMENPSRPFWKPKRAEDIADVCKKCLHHIRSDVKKCVGCGPDNDNYVPSEYQNDYYDRICRACRMWVDDKCTVDWSDPVLCLRTKSAEIIERELKQAAFDAKSMADNDELEKARVFTMQQKPKPPCDLCQHNKDSDVGPCIKCDDGNDQFTPVNDPEAPLCGADIKRIARHRWAAKVSEAIGQEQRQEPGKKFDQGKPRYDLLPGDVLDEITQIFTGGAEKYGDRNWEKGMSWGRVFGAAMRHMWSFWAGRTTDPESGRPHLAHAIVNLMFLLAYYIRGAGTDDRRVG